jgi:DNA polymerase III gamma/tau subunit
MGSEVVVTTQTLDKKYRSQDFTEFFGNDATINSLTTVLNRSDNIPGAILLQGPSGCGKTTLARIIISMLGADKKDTKQYNISNTRGIDHARSIVKYVQVAPWGKYKIIVLNECHKATKEFQNAILEVLEEPPPGVHFILCTTEPNMLLKTVRTRCTTYTVGLLGMREMTNLLNWVAEGEAVEIDATVAKAITASAEGSPRRALVMYDAVIDMESPVTQLDAIAKFNFSEVATIDLCRALAAGKPWKEVAGLIKALEEEPESVRRAILGYFSAILLKGGKQAPAMAIRMDHFAKNFYDTGKAGLVQACYFATKT